MIATTTQNGHAPPYEHGAEWLSTMPREVRVAHLVFQVDVMGPAYSREVERFGECNNNDQVIRLCSEMKAQKARETLLHEVIHALWTTYDMGRSDKQDEAVATLMPRALVCFKRDNPGAWSWIFGEDEC